MAVEMEPVKSGKRKRKRVTEPATPRAATEPDRSQSYGEPEAAPGDRRGYVPADAARTLDVIFLPEEIAAARAALGYREAVPAAVVVKGAVNRVVGAAQPFDFGRAVTAAEDTRAWQAGAKHVGVTVRVADRALAAANRLGADRFGCHDNAERVRWLVVRKLLTVKPAEMTQRMLAARMVQREVRKHPEA